MVRSQTNSHSDNVNVVVSNNSVQISGTTTGTPGSLTQPTGVMATDGTFSDKVRVTFNTVAGATVYRVHRCLTTGQTCGSPAAFRKVPVFDDFKGKSGVVYYYRVRACIGTTCGLFSAANSGYRGNLPSTEADAGMMNRNDVPIPTLTDVGRWSMILMMMGVGCLLLLRRYKEN